MEKRTCIIPGCGEPSRARLMCQSHYHAAKKRGEFAGTPPPRELITVEERFWQKVDKSHPGGCWEWTAFLNDGGYGQFSPTRTKKEFAHRFSYCLVHGEIPEGLEIDHLCRNRKCVNPDHLEAVTRSVNQLRGETIAAANAAKTHCVHGHEFTEENTYSRDGKRRCITCRRAGVGATRARKASAAVLTT